MARYTKLIVALGIPLLGLLGITVVEAEMTTIAAGILALLTALGVFAAPNKA